MWCGARTGWIAPRCCGVGRGADSGSWAPGPHLAQPGGRQPLLLPRMEFRAASADAIRTQPRHRRDDCRDRRDCYGAALALKWPNDLFHDDRKLGGILVEMVGEDSGRQRVIVGIGLNVDMPMGEGDAISRPWTDLRTVIGANIDRNELAGRLLSQLAEGLAEVDRYGMGEWLQRWRRWDYLKGRSVVVDGVPPVTGIAAGIDEGGALLVIRHQASLCWLAVRPACSRLEAHHESPGTVAASRCG